MHIFRRKAGVRVKKLSDREILAIDKNSIPADKVMEYKMQITSFIQRKNKSIRALMIAASAVFVVLMFFIVIARGAELIEKYPAVFWSVCGVLGAAFVVLAVLVGMNMYVFRKFLKKFE